MMLRRQLLGLFAATLLAACSTAPVSPPPNAHASHTATPPIVFVHGNGDNAALWQTTLWRFESNGWPRERLHAIDVPYPLARDDDTKPQAGRTSTAEHMAYLQSEVAKVLQSTGAAKVVLIANSRGGNAVRNFIQNGGGDKVVSHAILGGTPNHGVWAIKGFREGNEFSGTGPFLSGLNAAKNAAGDEVSGPVQWATIRSDNNDKFAQPDGLWIGQKGTPTFVTFAGPELKGATNIVIARIDHRETSFSPQAFDAAYRFITGKPHAVSQITPEQRIVLNGQITGLGLKTDDPASGNYVNNLPPAASSIEIYAVDSTTGVRLGDPVHHKSVGPTGVWGPFVAHPSTAYEFVISSPGYATTHIYRSAFARSSAIVHLRAERLAPADKAAAGATGAVVTLTRPRGYFDLSRDKLQFDGNTQPADLPASGAGLSVSKRVLANSGVRSIEGQFNGEKLVGRTWSAADNHVVILEITQ
jgi:triacylglycerol lipase